MLFDEETRYWQGEYAAGNIDDEDCGELRAILDGTAERYMLNGFIIFLWSLIPILVMGVLAYIQRHYPITYTTKVQPALKSWGFCFGLNIDPTLGFLLTIITVIIVFNIIKKIE